MGFSAWLFRIHSRYVRSGDRALLVHSAESNRYLQPKARESCMRQKQSFMELGRRARRLPSFSILNSGRPVHMLFHSLPSWATSRREPFVSPSSLAGWVINAASSFGTNDFFRSTSACSIASISQQKARFSHTRRDRNGHLATFSATTR